jgi:hypothetical protein
LSLSTALDLMHDVLSGWIDLFLKYPQFRELLRDPVCTSFVPLLKTMRSDYMTAIGKHMTIASGNAGNTVSTSASGTNAQHTSVLTATGTL